MIAADSAAGARLEDYPKAAAALAEVAEVAARAAVRIAVEFRKGSGFCACLETATALVAEVGTANVGVCLDMFHYMTGPSKFDDLALLSGGSLAWVQVSDVSGTPREVAGDADRILPGDGDFPVGPVLGAVASLGYDGYVSLEVLNPSLWSIPADHVGQELRALGLLGPRPDPRPARGGRARLTVSTATAIPAPVAVYREEQLFGWWIYALMAVMLAIACYFLSIRHEAEQGPERGP